MNEQIKELLKPPFTVRENYIFNADGIALFMLSSNAIENMGTDYAAREQLSEGILEFGKDAMNEKWERDCVEPMRWIYYPYSGVTEQKIGNYYECPKCNKWQTNTSDYCPRCGQKLLPPEDI